MREDLIERLRKEADLIHNNGITRKLPRHRVAALLREAADALEAAREDAERYRWLKKSAFCNVWARGDGIALVAPRTPVADIDSKIDAAIDRAREKGGQEVGK